jgi:lipopolysaccharide export system protein LptA
LILLRTFSLLPVCLASAWCQTDRVDLVADKLTHDSAVVHGSGHARAKIGSLILQADEATLHQETGELEMRGHVHITLPAREDHTVVRYQIAVLLTDQPIGLTADQATVKNGVLAASGNIVVSPADPELSKVEVRGDELSMKLDIGDATLRGNIRRSGIPEPVNYPFRMPYPVFPPEIIK